MKTCHQVYMQVQARDNRPQKAARIHTKPSNKFYVTVLRNIYCDIGPSEAKWWSCGK